jgi:phenylacetate-CoA ligase
LARRDRFVSVPTPVARDPSSDLSPQRRAANLLYVAALAQVESRVPFWPIERTMRLQRRRVRAIVGHAYRTVPFYRREMDARGLRPAQFATAEDLMRLPLISASDIAHSPTDFVSTLYRDHNRESFQTSGTSGTRKTIYQDHGFLVRRIARSERDRRVVAKLADETWPGLVAREFLADRGEGPLGRLFAWLTEDHARLSIFPADFASRTERAMWNQQSFVPRKAVHRHHLSPHASFEEVINRLNELRPRVVLSFGSYVEHFMRALASTGRTAALPRVWVYMGDMISDHARHLAEQRYGVRLYSVYGAMEAGSIGFQCERREGFHLNVDLCALRVIDEQGQALPPGEAGEVVVSPLDNRAMVLLNYHLGDRAMIEPGPCPCGRSLPLLSGLEGRRSEVVTLPCGRQLSTLALEGFFAAELARTQMAQLEQTGINTLRWKVVVADRDERDALRRAFLAQAAEQLGADVELTVEFVDEIARTPQGKFRRVLSAPVSEEVIAQPTIE